MDAEMRAHVEMQIQENLRAGMNPEEARRIALLRFGGVESTKETCREQRPVAWLGHIVQDFWFGVRMLRKNPGFTVLAVLTLALGIMATTAMYSVLYAVVLDPFPYKEVDRLMSVKVWDPAQSGYRTDYSTDQFLEIAEKNTIFEGVIASTISDVAWIGDGDPKRLRGNYGTPNTFLVMGVPPLLGRTILPSDGQPDAAPVAVLGYRFWQRQFGGDPAVLGRRLRLNDKVRTVVGVMPKRFMWRGADVYLPVVFHRGQVAEGITDVHLLGRLKPGVTEAQAEVDLKPIIAELKQREPSEFPERWRVGILSFKQTFPSDIRESLWILFAAVGLLLVIACANVSNLLLSKVSVRQKEMAVRSALGASRARLFAQLLTESLLLAVAAGALGVGLAYGGLRAIISLVPPNTIPDESEIALNLPVLLFALGISALTSIFCGLAPALHICSRDLAISLRETAGGVVAGLRQALLRKGLLIAEVALALILLVAAGLMVRTFAALQNFNLGFQPDRVLTLRVPLAERQYPDLQHRNAFFLELLNRVGSLPGVKAVGINSTIYPMGNYRVPIDVAGSPQADTRRVQVHQINPDYLRAFGIRLLEGRSFDQLDLTSMRHVALVSQTFVKTRLQGGATLGRTFRIPALAEPPLKMEDTSFQVVGVVRDSPALGAGARVMPEIYLPFTVVGLAERIAILTEADARSATRAVLDQVYTLDRNQPVTNLGTLKSEIDDGIYAQPRFSLSLFGVFAGLGLILAVLGVYGVMANSVAQQTHDFGVRLAIGATPGDVAWKVVMDGARLLLAGIGLGLLGAVLMARLLSSQIWNVSPFDPLSFGVVTLILLAVGILACLWPARRAATIEPIEALRYE
jgi:predicted permease